jgi:cysteinyl-tRNA synthetase
MLKVYNTLTKSKEEFKSIQPGKIGLYACGMTVYDYCHIGHARALIAFDIIVRFLRYSGYDVKYIRNITDVDDKIIGRANENKEDFTKLTERFIQAMHEDCDSLDLLVPNEEPRATKYMDKIIAMVKALVDKGYAYVGQNGDVYYNISKFKDYGKLSHRNIEELQVGSRVKASEAKNNPLDFALWKLAKPDEPSWDSPWGKGRPGWHIECSAMATTCIANHIDIHGGGRDLIFPHHENEIAQAEAATGEKFVNYWLHAGSLQVDNTKMSKSLGNFFTIRDVLKKFDPEVIRYFMITSHYRSPLNYSEADVAKAKSALERLYTALRGLDIEGVEYKKHQANKFEEPFLAAMNDDFNTPEALSVLFGLSREINRLRDKDEGQAKELASLLKHLGGVFDILQQDPDKFLQGNVAEESEAKKIEALIQARNDARKNKDWAEADRVRGELTSMGIVLEDNQEGTTWRRGG